MGLVSPGVGAQKNLGLMRVSAGEMNLNCAPMKIGEEGINFGPICKPRARMHAARRSARLMVYL